jgi:hypothetical protein
MKTFTPLTLILAGVVSFSLAVAQDKPAAPSETAASDKPKVAKEKTAPTKATAADKKTANAKAPEKEMVAAPEQRQAGEKIAAAKVRAAKSNTESVYQKQGNEQIIELSNIEDTSVTQVPIVTGPAQPPSTPGAANSREAATTKRVLANKTGEEIDKDDAKETDSVETPNSDAKANAKTGAAGVDTPNGSSSISGQGSVGSGGSGGSGPLLNGNASPSKPNAGGVDTSPATPPSAGNTPTTPTSPTAPSATAGPSIRSEPVTGGATSKPINNALDASLTSILQSYRQLMIQDATAPNAINGNPAVSRRYLQVDRNVYVSGGAPALPSAPAPKP